MRKMLILVATAVLAHPVHAQKIPGVPTQKPEFIDPKPRTDYGCMREDRRETTAAIMAALEQGKKTGETPEVEPTMKAVAGCVYYRVSLKSNVLVEDIQKKDLTEAISGHGSVVFGLAPDGNQGSEYDFTSGNSAERPKIPVVWDLGSAKLTREGCVLTTVERPYTFYDVWLGLTNSGSRKLAVVISPAGPDLHDVTTRCKDPMGISHDLKPSKQGIHAQAWSALYGEGKKKISSRPVNAKTAAGIAQGKPPAGSDAMTATMMNLMNSGASPEQMMKAISEAPGLQGQLAAAEDNFMFTMPGDCKAISVSVTRCELNDKRELEDQAGYGTLKRITMRSTITIEKLPPRTL